MGQRFPGLTLPELGGADVEAVAFAYLQASLRFTRPYADNEKPLPFRATDGKTRPVRSFGIPFYFGTRSDLFDQIAILSWQGSGNDQAFVLDPCKDSSPYQMLLAQVPRQKTLAATLADLEARIRDGTGRNRDKEFDSFFVPHFRFRLAHRFAELEGRALLNPATKGLFLSRAEQDIDFRLDGTGAVLKSRAYPVGAKGGPRELHLDGPFALVMRKRGETRPFFVLWVDNDELLEPWE